MSRQRVSPLFALLLVLSVAVVPASAAGALEVQNRAWDAGDVELGDVLEHDFVLRNTGDEPVEIYDVSPQCGCTVPDYPSIIEPGEDGTIRLVIDTSTLHTGKNSKTTTVRTSAQGAERIIFQVKMRLYTPLELLPKPLVYLRSTKGVSREQKVLARPHRDGMKITGVSSDNPNIAVSFVEADAPEREQTASQRLGRAPALLPRDGDAYVVVKLLETAPVGLHRAKVHVQTSDPEYPEAVIKVNVVVREPDSEG